MNDTDYDSHYDEIFENDNPELDGQMPTIDRLRIYFNTESSCKTDDKDGNNDFFQDNDLVNSIGRRD